MLLRREGKERSGVGAEARAGLGVEERETGGKGRGYTALYLVPAIVHSIQKLFFRMGVGERERETGGREGLHGLVPGTGCCSLHPVYFFFALDLRRRNE